MMSGFISFHDQISKHIERLGPQEIAARYHGADEHDGEAIAIGDLQFQAEKFAQSLGQRISQGDRVILLYPSGPDFIIGFLGCLYAGAVAVPVSAPSKRKGLSTFKAIVSDSEANLIVGPQETLDPLSEGLKNEFSECGVKIISHEEMLSAAPDTLALPVLKRDDLAFLQYTSGSTGTPKGVMVSHGNLYDQMVHLQRHYSLSDKSVCVNWLPFYHDMGLIGMILLSLHAQAELILMQPAAFMRRPLKWLELISRYGGTFTFAPNFAYDLCVKAAKAADLSGIDLSSVQMMINAAEPVHASTIADFQRVFAPYGLAENAVCSGFGLAEATLVVSCTTCDHPPVLLKRARSDDGQAEDRSGKDDVVSFASYRAEQEDLWRFYPSNGAVLQGHQAYAVDPKSFEVCKDGQLGEIWFGGPNLPQGYWNKPEATKEVFAAHTADGMGPFLRTGDFGTLVDGQIYILGRIKDTIIRRGKNLYPHDLERSCALASPLFKQDGAAVVGVQGRSYESIIVVQELKRTAITKADFPTLAGQIRQAISAEFDVVPDHIIFIKPHALPRTTSGKIRRRHLGELFKKGEIAGLYKWSAPAADTQSAAKPVGSSPMEIIQGWLMRELSLPSSAIRPDVTFSDLGFESLHAAALAEHLQTTLDQPVNETCFWEYPVLSELAAHLERGSASDTNSIRDELEAELALLEGASHG